ncbi:LLM class flavin-dependent oxidoreductase [Actinophytocola sp.]|uniref:LLM class flavin-dependent oxidoreductase n=1 Tax=Actinophytocola sp. TaxID=1872138 RepID=UPI003D6A7EB8
MAGTRVGVVILPEYRWLLAEPKWRAVETYGFDHAWTYDHIGWRSLVDGPWFDAVPTLTAAAMVTRRIRLGTLVASPNFRHPVPFARSLLALDDVSSGRFVLGVGSGGIVGYDNEVLGGSALGPKARLARFAEFLEQLDSLLTHERTTIRGEYFSSVDARSAPGCVQHPRLPFVVAANTPGSMRLAARFGQGWITTGRKEDHADETGEAWWRGVGAQARRFDELLEGRTGVHRYLSVDSGPRYSLSSVEYFRDALGRAAELGFTDLVTHWPRPDGVYAGGRNILEKVAADVLPHR